MKAHKEKKNCEGSFHCDSCEKTCTTNALLMRHKDYCSGKQYICSICNKNFANRSQLKHHQILHANLRAHGCPECGKRFNLASDLRVHQRIHTGVKAFKCNSCDKSFLTSSGLQSHKNVHTDQKPFVCGFNCGKAFKSFQNLKRHNNEHCVATAEPLECDDCGKLFKNEANLKGHKKIHNDDVFPCPECEKSFAVLVYLKVHMRKMHSNNKMFNNND